MAYITHDTVKNTSVNSFGGLLKRTAVWLKSLLKSSSGHQLDAYNEHLLRDAGLTPDSRSNAIDWRRARRLGNQTLYTPQGNSTAFLDLYLSEHNDRRPQGF